MAFGAGVLISALCFELMAEAFEKGGMAIAVGATTALAARGILAMLVDTMIPEAFEGAHDYSGLIAAAGFLCSFALSMA